MGSKPPIKVLIVDDSAIVRSVLKRVLSGEQDIVVVGGAKDPYEAREFIITHKPNVIILDIEMPRMDGLTFLKKLQKHYPVPVIMCSGVAPANSEAALRAIELGAVDIVAKSSDDGHMDLKRTGHDLAEKIRAAAMAMPVAPAIPGSARKSVQSFREFGLDPGRYLVVIGASTGGTEAVKNVLSCTPEDFPPVAIVQHMPVGFTKSFADRLDQFSKLAVTEAVEGDLLEPGRAVVARGDRQMGVVRSGGKWRIAYGDTETVNRHCPSVDVLFDAAAAHAGDRAVGILLTGMGADGAKGLLTMRGHGAITIAQEQRSCVVFGMPKVAIDLGAAQHIATPSEVPATVCRALNESRGVGGARRTSSALSR